MSATRIFKTKTFARWMRKERLRDTGLLLAARDIMQGKFEANLGGNVYKKRIPLAGRGKRGGLRTLIAFSHGSRVVFIFGYSKNDRASVAPNELSALRLLAKTLLGASDATIETELRESRLIEVKNNGH